MHSDAPTSVCSESLATFSQSEQDPSAFLRIISPQDKPWDDHRYQAEQVTDILGRGLPHHQRQAERMRICSDHLEFGWVTESTETGLIKLRLKAARFCRVRTCPVCQWRRSLMWVARFYHAFPRIYADHPELRYIMLTLTVRNCRVLDLRTTIKQMNAGWDRLTKRRTWPAVGFVRSLEITRGKDGSAHPHFHCLLAVPPGYFAGKNYLSAAKWAALWQEALRTDYTPICDVRAVKPKEWDHLRHTSPLGVQEVMMDEVRNAIISPDTFDKGGASSLGGPGAYEAEFDAIRPTKVEVLLSAITEVIKYAVKPDDMVADPDWLLELSDQLRNARSVALGGILREYLSEQEPENLVSEDEASTEKNPGGVHFGWREDPRFAQYKRKREAAAP